ncbi:hypothetical protein [Methanococcus maripaludis]|uniref:Uncharacterized protein n=1 Tax=Methanococcus maripaludis TaxID=39152 RepID=A0A7J9S2J2_METMI|nr:hypothetical protein [Methanococcus maripaludis]MBB6068184.1 hypothetical protein [Methanococcus maripaludis]
MGGDKEFLEALEKYYKYCPNIKTDLDFIGEIKLDYELYGHDTSKLGKLYSQENLKTNSRLWLIAINTNLLKSKIVKPLLNSLDTDIRSKLEKFQFEYSYAPKINAEFDTMTNKVIIYDILHKIYRFYAKSKIIERGIHKYDPNLADEFIKGTCSHIFKFYDVAKKHPYDNKNRLPKYNLPIAARLAAKKNAGMYELFILAHEYAHVYRGHKATEKISESVARQQEIDADSKAVEWIINLKENLKNGSEMHFTPDISLIADEFMLVHVLEVNGILKEDYHPKSKERLQNIYENVKDKLTDSEIESFENTLKDMDLNCKIENFEISEELEEKLKNIIENTENSP